MVPVKYLDTHVLLTNVITFVIECYSALNVINFKSGFCNNFFTLVCFPISVYDEDNILHYISRIYRKSCYRF